MNHKITRLIVLGLFAAFVVGCGTATTPTPLPTQPAQVITVIITATPPPPTATSVAPTVTPMPTLPLTSTVVAATPTQAVAKATTAPRPAATRTATKPGVAPTATALPLKFGSPRLTRPIWTENQKDEAKFPGGAIILDWQSIGGLGSDECYLVRITTEPVNPAPGIDSNRSDYWVDKCGDQTGAGASVKFTLEPPRLVGAAPNYGSILLNTNEMWATWTVTVVKNLGDCDPSYKYHCKTAPISPPGQGRFLFKGG
ncbi:MAG: hypothetical protein L0Y55_05480 [Anaerolineales bacterium]|nr:hypothetical protein [Anaerolineales bacterium]